VKRSSRLARFLRRIAHDWHVSGCAECAEGRAVLIVVGEREQHVPVRSVRTEDLLAAGQLITRH